MLRTISILCAVATLGLLAWATHSALRPAPNAEPAFIVSSTEQNIGTVSLGNRAVTFPITNPDSKPRRIVGLEET